MSATMTRVTRRQAAAEPSSDEDEGSSQASPAQPAEPEYIPSSSDLAQAHEDFQRFAFLQAIMQRGFMNEADAKAMYRQLTDSPSGRHDASKQKMQWNKDCLICKHLTQILDTMTLWRKSMSLSPS